MHSSFIFYAISLGCLSHNTTVAIVYGGIIFSKRFGAQILRSDVTDVLQTDVSITRSGKRVLTDNFLSLIHIF